MKLQEARPLYEEAYNVRAMQYNSSHELVLDAGEWLVEILLQTHNFYDAERYARISYECLTRPVDNESIQIVDAAASLASASLQLLKENSVEGCDIVEVEMLSRKTLRIAEAFYIDQRKLPRSYTISKLAGVVQFKPTNLEEAKLLFERS